MGGSDPYASIHCGGSETKGLPVEENHPDCSGMAQHALLLGSGGYVKPNPAVPAQSADTPFQSDSTQELSNLNHHGLLLEPQ